mmetsp:Transcript_9134/g.13009  ORF Transcript_9134/g.13009 Transcript_9134/m.13009 type:complete len:449 (+) Transcript_9134:160-1506(+)
MKTSLNKSDNTPTNTTTTTNTKKKKYTNYQRGGTTTTTTNNINNNNTVGEYTYHSLVSHLSVEPTTTSSDSDSDDKNNEMVKLNKEMTKLMYNLNKHNVATPKKMLREMILCLGFGMVGWYGPKVFKPTPEQVQHIPVPYQVMPSNGDVVLDFDLNHPWVDPPAIPSNLLIHSSITIPFLLMMCIIQIMICVQGNINCGFMLGSAEIHSLVCSFSLAIGSSEGITQVIKYFVLRKRPNFYALCGFNTSTLKCEAPLDRIQEAMFSFPSGHTSLSFCGMTFLVWFLLGKLVRNAMAARHNYIYGSFSVFVYPTQKICMYACMILPWGYSTYVGVTRIVDTWHHVDDVLAGCFIGTTCATIAYHLYYPFFLLTSSSYSTNDTTKFVGYPWIYIYNKQLSSGGGGDGNDNDNDDDGIDSTTSSSGSGNVHIPMGAASGSHMNGTETISILS